MDDEALEQLRRANPVPGSMPGLPIETMLRRLDDEPPSSTERSSDSRPAARRFLRAVPVALSAAVVLAVATVVISAGSHHRPARPPASSGEAPSSRSPSQGGRHAGTSAGGYFLDYLLPRTGADWAAGSRVTAFTAKLSTRLATRCLVAHGFPGPPVYGQPSQKFGNVDFPNMPVIERTRNVGVTTVRAPTDPAKSLPPTRRKAYTAALARCEASAGRTTGLPATRQAGTLMNAWMNLFTRVSASPAIRAADRRAASCSRATPFPATTVGREIQTIEAKLTPLTDITGHEAQAKAVNAHGVRVLLRCFGSVETLRDRLMTAQRARFVAQHAPAIRQITNEVNHAVAADEAKYGVKLNTAATGAP